MSTDREKQYQHMGFMAGLLLGQTIALCQVYEVRFPVEWLVIEDPMFGHIDLEFSLLLPEREPVRFFFTKADAVNLRFPEILETYGTWLESELRALKGEK